MSTVIAGSDVYAIAEDLFAAMVDGVPGTLRPWQGPPPHWDDPVVAWVDVQGGWSGCAVVTTGRPTADALARALLVLPAAEPVADDDLRDAFGEIANVVGGNVKSLLPGTGTLGLPQVARAAPEVPGALVVAHVLLDWGGRALELTVRATPPGEADGRERGGAR